MRRSLFWALSTVIVVPALLTGAGCSAAPPPPAVSSTCGPPQTNELPSGPSTAAGCTSLVFTAPGTYTVTVKFPPSGAHTTIDYTLTGAGGGGGRGPGPGGAGAGMGFGPTGGGGGGGGGAGTTISATGIPLAASAARHADCGHWCWR